MTDWFDVSCFFIRDLHRKGFIPRGHSWLLWGFASLRLSKRLVSIESPETGNLFLDLKDRGQCGYFLYLGLPQELPDIALIQAGAPFFKVIFDIGAHIGYYTRVFMIWAPQASVHAFEPSPRSFEMLQKNVESRPNIKLNQKAVAKTTAPRQFFLKNSSDLSSIVKSGGKRITVGATTLDDYCTENSLESVDMIKCDVEGAEWEVISGARELLASSCPPLWLLENVASYRKVQGINESTLVSFLRKYSLQPLSFFYTQAVENKIRLVECDPERVPWENASHNVWVVPEHWKEKFFKMAEAAVPVRRS